MSSAELERFASLLQSACGVTRTRVPIVDKKAGERALEARQQVGLNYTGTSSDLIQHPSPDEIRKRLGWTGEQISVTELAVWNYLWRDPVLSAVNGLMASPSHAPWLRSTAYTHWGVGIYSELPPGRDEIERRRYFIVWLTTGVPKPKQVDLPVGLAPTKFLWRPDGPASAVIGMNGSVNVRLSASLASDQVDFATGATGAYRAILLGDVEGQAWNGDTRWSAFWIPERGGYRYAHKTLRGLEQAVEL
jgi:hypothetical protein